MSNWLAKVLHEERTSSGSLKVDCWACEAARSPTVLGLIKSLRAAEARADHTQAVLDRAVPDDEAQKELWRTHWRHQIAARRANPSAPDLPEESDQ